MRRNTLLLTFAILLCLAGMAMACPNCSDTVASADAAGSPGISAAFNSSIYIMLGGFIGVLGMVTFVMVKAIRNE